MTINVESEQVKNLILEMDRNGMLKIVRDHKKSIADLKGSMDMTESEIDEFDKYIKQSRKESDERLPA